MANPQPRRRFLERVLRLLRLVWQTHPGYTLTLAILSLAQGLLPLGNVWVGKLIIDSVVHAIASESSEQWLGPIVSLVGIELGLTLLISVASFVQQLIQDLFGVRLANRIGVMVLEKATSLDLATLEDGVFYDKLQRAQREAGSRPLALLSYLATLTQSILSLLGLSGLLFRYGFSTVLILLLATLPNAVMQWRYARKGYLIVNSQTPGARKLSYIGLLLTSLVSFKEIKTFGLGQHLIHRYKELQASLCVEKQRLSIRQNVVGCAFTGVAKCAFFGFYVYAVRRTVLGIITLGDLTLFSGSFSQVQSSVQAALSSIKGIYEMGLFADDLFEFLELQSRIRVASQAKPAPSSVTQSIQFRNVSFSYPGSNIPALKNVSFTIKPGQSVALVGENGSGKTTLVRLLCRLYDVSEGEILVDETNIAEYEPRSLCSLVSVVFQDFMRYELSARENIGFGQVGVLNDDDKIRKAAHSSRADVIIDGLSRGYETVLGRLFENSAELSLGQWQRLALARSFVQDAPVIVWDEPTSSLDPRVEREVLESLRELTSKKIVIMVSHRLSTARMADCIYVLKQGAVVESGSHDDLMALGGHYAQLFRIQAAGYR